MNARTVLEAWQKQWQRLSANQAEAFLGRAEVALLATMPEQTARMSIRAHQRLVEEVFHARWLEDGRRPPAACGCEYDDVPEPTAHVLTITPGPATRVGGRSPSSPTSSGRCTCGWEARAGSDMGLRSAWQDHVHGDDELPVDEYS